MAWVRVGEGDAMDGRLTLVEWFIVDRKLRRRQLTEDGNVEISGRDLR